MSKKMPELLTEYEREIYIRAVADNNGYMFDNEWEKINELIEEGIELGLEGYALITWARAEISDYDDYSEWSARLEREEC